MKKNRLLMIMFASAALLFAGCSKDKDDDSPYKKEIIGTWDGIAVKTSSGWIDITSSYYSDYQFSITFHEDGTYYGTGYFGTGSGTYTLNDNTIVTYVNGNEYYRYDIYSVSGNVAHLKMYSTRSSSSIEIKARKR